MKPVLAALLLACSGCAVLKGAETPMTLRLSPAAPVVAGVVAGPSFAVAPAQARGLAGAQRYTYVAADAPAEMRQAATIFWEEPPAQVLTRALVAGLRGRFARVAGPEARAVADRRVIATLDRFEEQGAGGAAQALVAFDVTLAGAVSASGRYCSVASIAGATGTARATAFETAMAAAVGAFVQDAGAERLRVMAC